MPSDLQTADDIDPYWQLTNIPKDTKARIKAYAARNNLKLGEALTRLIDLAEWTAGKDLYG